MSIDFGFGKSKNKTSEQSSPYFRSTGFSSYDPFSRKLTLDPSIRALQDEGINRARGMMGEVGGAVSGYRDKLLGVRSRLEGNASPLTEARVNPIRQQNAQRQGALQRSLGLRNVSGSSFADQSMNNLAFESGRAEGDARALAEADNISAITGIDKDIVSSVMQKVQLEAQLNGYTTDIANQRLQQELAAFGLGRDSTSTSRGTQFTAGAKFDFQKPPVGGTG